MMTMAPASYRETLLLYYEEEIEGEAYFATLATRFSDPDHREKLRLLAKVEAHAAFGVEPLIEKYALVPRAADTLIRKGVAEAQSETSDWAALLSDMRRTYPVYTEQFRVLEAAAPSEDRPHLAFLTRHEVAALEFLALEETRPEDSAKPLRAYLSDGPEV